MYRIKKKELIRNFSRCKNWKEKYLYIIEIGESLPITEKNIRKDKYLIHGCQSRVWIKIITDSKKNFSFFGDSDSSIVKGLIAVIFVYFREFKEKKKISFEEDKENLKLFLSKLSLLQNLTPSRVRGIEFIVQFIYIRLQNLRKKL